MSGAIADPHEPTQTVEPAQAQAKTGLLEELLDLDRRRTSVAAATAPAPVLAGPAPVLGTRVGRFVAWAAGEPPMVEFAGNDHGPLAARSIISLDPSVVAAAITDHRGVLLTFEDGRPDAPIITGLLQPILRLSPEPEPPTPPTPTPQPDTPGPINPEPDQPISPQPVQPSQPGPEFEPGRGPEYDPPSPPEFEPRPGPEFEPQPQPEFQPNRQPEQGEFESAAAELGSPEMLDMRVDGRRVEIEAADEIVLRCGEASIVMRRNGRVVIRGTYVETRSRGVNRVKGGSVEIN